MGSDLRALNTFAFSQFFPRPAVSRSVNHLATVLAQVERCYGHRVGIIVDSLLAEADETALLPGTMADYS